MERTTKSRALPLWRPKAPDLPPIPIAPSGALLPRGRRDTIMVSRSSRFSFFSSCCTPDGHMFRGSGEPLGGLFIYGGKHASLKP